MKIIIFFKSNEYIPKYSKELKELYKITNYKYMDEDIGEYDVKYTIYGVKNIKKIKKILNSIKELNKSKEKKGLFGFFF
jgi:uncharacterized protein (DUF1015 family)